ncbi:fatty acid desaturase [Zhengella sp. ZM62]|uniref:fatty acid desaturase n=1 Tax=Zhengella sedimenti TaxID=3390035 RepID=UPI003974CFF7
MKDTKRWSGRLRSFAQADDRRGFRELALTLGLLAVLWLAAALLFAAGHWLLSLPLLPLAALMLVRLFIIQHDCGHGSLFTTAALNDRVGRLLGVLTFTPYGYWRHSHNLHHAGSGNLDRRGIGDISTLTTEEYRALGLWGRLAYRAYRHPLVMFVIGPAYVFLVQQRWPSGFTDRREAWVSALGTNAGILLFHGALWYVFGWQVMLAVHLPVILMGAVAGVWLFYIQHQFDPTFWARAPEWEREQAALEGSSFYDLPRPLMWATGYIGIHHVHHLAARVPFWRLPEVLKAYPEFRDKGRLTFWQSLKCVRLTLWDEPTHRLVSFADFRRMEAA